MSMKTRMNALNERRKDRNRTKIRASAHGRMRLSVHRSSRYIYAQVIDDQSGHTLLSASTVDRDLREKMKGLKKAEQAKLVGQTVAERAKDKGIQAVVFDRGGYRYIGRIKALADGAREAGLQF